MKFSKKNKKKKTIKLLGYAQNFKVHNYQHYLLDIIEHLWISCLKEEAQESNKKKINEKVKIQSQKKI